MDSRELHEHLSEDFLDQLLKQKLPSTTMNLQISYLFEPTTSFLL